MHRETTIARDIKLLKNKFELLEKNRQFRGILNKSGIRGMLTYNGAGESNGASTAADTQGDDSSRSQSEASLGEEGEKGSPQTAQGKAAHTDSRGVGLVAQIKSKMLNMNMFRRILNPFFYKFGPSRRKSNRVSSVSDESGCNTVEEPASDSLDKPTVI